MAVNTQLKTAGSLPLVNRPGLLRAARWITHTGSPLALGTLALALIGLADGTAAGWRMIFFYALLTLGGPAAFIGWLVHTGAISDFNLPHRHERHRPMLVSLATAALGLLWLALQADPPPLLIALAFATLLQGTLFFAVTFFWKISMHGAVAGAFAVLALALYGSVGALFWPAVPLIAWSRVVLRRHTPLQTVAGAAAGGGLLWIALYTLGIW